MLEHLRLLGRYNQWMNEKVYSTSAELSAAELVADRGAFFGSLLGTLNHIMVADIVWLKRFAAHPAQHQALAETRATTQPDALSGYLFDDFSALRAERERLDRTIIEWCNELGAADLSHKLSYRNMKGEPALRNFGGLVLHFFNHQTHHRGQATTLLSQQGLDVGVTDLVTLIPNEIEP